MDKRTLVYLVQLVLLYGAHQTHERLPKYVFIVESCPYPNNIIEWEKASYRLNCLHPPKSTDTGNAYHCLPTSFSNETVEFCGEGISVPPGHCPIYNYTDKADDKPGLYNCFAFISGCPTESFSSKDVRKFPSCLNINRKRGCYEEESSCPKTSVTQVTKETTNNEKTATISTVSSIPTDSSPDIPTPDDRDKAIYVPTIIIVIGTFPIIGLIIGLIISLIYLYKYRSLYLQKKKDTARIDERIKMESTEDESKDNSSNEETEQSMLLPLKNHTVPEKTDECASESKEFDDFLQTVGSCITDKIWQSMRAILLSIMDLGCIEKLKTTRILFELSELLTFQYNIPFLELIFEECHEHYLVQKCKMFTAKNKFEFQEFQTNCIPCGGNEHVKFMMTKTGNESITDQINNLRNWIGETINVHPGRILLTSLYQQTEPVAVTFMMRDKHAKSLLDLVKTDDGQIALCRKGIEKIIHDDNVFKIDKAINGTHYVKLRLSSNEIRENNIKKAASCVLQKAELQMEGEEIYMTVLPKKQKRKEYGCESSSKRKLTKKERDSLLENFEPMTVCDTVMTSMFDRNDIIMMRNINGRREKVERFLEMCDKLPREKYEEMYSSYFVEHLTSSKSVPSYEEIGTAENWTQQEQDDLLDEIDSNFIETAIGYMEDVSEADKEKWSDPQKGRRERAKIFLDFVKQRDDYVIVVKRLQETIKEKGTKFFY